MTYPQTPAAAGVSQLASRYALDVETGGNMTTVFGVFSFQPQATPNMQDNSDFESGFLETQFPVSVARNVTLSLRDKLYNGVQDPGQAAIQAAADSQPPTLIKIRYYDRYGNGDAVEAMAYATWEPQGGDARTESTVNVTLSLQTYTTVSNPVSAPAVVPVITDMYPAGKGGDELVTIVGSGFGDAVSVDMDGKAADFTITGQGQIVAVIPSAVTIGAQDVVVTNGAGPSAPFSYTFA